MNKRANKIHSYKKIALNFISLAIVLLGLIVYFIFYKVEILVIPVNESIGVDFLIEVRDEDSKLKTTDDIVDGDIEEVEVDGEKEFKTSGEKEVSSDDIGSVFIINEENFDQQLVVKTRLLTSDNVLFRIKKGVIVPANGEIEVGVYADDENFSGIIEPTKLTIPGLSSRWQKTIYAENRQNLGGTKKISVLTQEDINIAREEFSDELYKQTKDEFYSRNKNKIGFKLVGKVPKIKRVEEKKVLDSRVDTEVGDEVESFKIYLKVGVVEVSFDEQEIRGLAEQKLIESIPDDKKFIGLDKNSFNYVLDDFNSEKSRAQIKVYVSGDMVISDDSRVLDINDIAGRSIDDVMDTLERSPAIESVKIKTPFNLLKTIPKQKTKIRIAIQEK